MAALKQIEADLKKQDREFQARMDALRTKLEASTKSLSSAEQRKIRLMKEQERIAKELAEADEEISKQSVLKVEITKSIVNLQELQAAKRLDRVSNSLGPGASGAPGASGTTNAPSGVGGWGASLTGWMGGSNPQINKNQRMSQKISSIIRMKLPTLRNGRQKYRILVQAIRIPIVTQVTRDLSEGESQGG